MKSVFYPSVPGGFIRIPSGVSPFVEKDVREDKESH
jgi:hypothetical protein